MSNHSGLTRRKKMHCCSYRMPTVSDFRLGRWRCGIFAGALYGSTRGELVAVPWSSGVSLLSRDRAKGSIYTLSLTS